MIISKVVKGNGYTSLFLKTEINEPPKANAGKDVTLTLPLSLVELDGSRSKDDVEIKEWSWERQSDSLAAGIILGNSDKSPILKVSYGLRWKWIGLLKSFYLFLAGEFGSRQVRVQVDS